MIRTTLFRQTQFSEFEEFAHKTVEEGQPLTKENLSDKYNSSAAKIQKKPPFCVMAAHDLELLTEQSVGLKRVVGGDVINTLVDTPL